MPLFVPGEQTPKRTTEEQCEASRRLAVLYAQHGEDGFKEIASITGVIPTDNYFSRSKIEVDDVDTAAWETMFSQIILDGVPIAGTVGCIDGCILLRGHISRPIYYTIREMSWRG